MDGNTGPMMLFITSAVTRWASCGGGGHAESTSSSSTTNCQNNNEEEEEGTEYELADFLLLADIEESIRACGNGDFQAVFS